MFVPYNSDQTNKGKTMEEREECVGEFVEPYVIKGANNLNVNKRPWFSKQSMIIGLKYLSPTKDGQVIFRQDRTPN